MGKKVLFFSLLAILIMACFLPASTIDASGDPWYDTQWLYRKKLTFDNSASSENLTDFPVLIKLASSKVDYNKMQDSGQDIRFTDSDGETLLDYEIEKWNATGDSFIWVKVPQIDADSITDFIWMYYGNNSAVDSQDAENVWDNNYELVTHMKDDPDTSSTRDSTIYGHTGVKKAAGEPTEVSGQIGLGQSFDGANDNLLIYNNLDYISKGDIGEGGHTQGVATDGTYFWITDKEYLTKLDSDWNQLDYVYVGDYFGDCTYYNGKIYAVDSSANETRVHNADTLAFETSYALTGLAGVPSGIAFDGTDFWICTYGGDPDFVYRYNTDFVYQGESHSLASNFVQGIEWYGSTLIVVRASGIYAYKAFLQVWDLTTGCQQGLTIYDDILYQVEAHNKTVRIFDFHEIVHWEVGTFEYWYNPSDPWYNWNRLWRNSRGAQEWEMFIYNDGRLAARLSYAGDKCIYDLDGISGPGFWYHICLTWELGGNKILYVDGVARSTKAVTYTAPYKHYLGGVTGEGLGKGLGDEFRVSSSIRSAAWIKASYLSGTDAFITFGIEEGFPLMPTNFTLTIDGNTIIGTWVKGIRANNTVIVRGENRYPESLTDGIVTFNGTETTFVDNTGHIGTELGSFYYSAWSHSEWGFSNDYATGKIGGESMALMAELFFIIGLAGLAVWQKHIILYIGAFIGILLVGLDLAATSWALGIPTLALAGYMIYKAIRVYI